MNKAIPLALFLSAACHSAPERPWWMRTEDACVTPPGDWYVAPWGEESAGCGNLEYPCVSDDVMRMRWGCQPHGTLTIAPGATYTFMGGYVEPQRGPLSI